MSQLIESYYQAKEKALKLMHSGDIKKYFQAVFQVNELEQRIEMMKNNQNA